MVIKRFNVVRIISMFLVVFIIASLFGTIKISAASGISDLWVDASSIVANSYTDGRKSTDIVRWWYNRNDEKYYLMMPNSATLSKLKVFYDASDVVKVNGKSIVSGQETDVFKSGGRYTLTCGSRTYNLVIQKPSKIPSMFISTKTGSLRTIHADKSNKEPGLMLLVGADGSTVYNDSLETIKGRGNATWLDYPKKPYNIKLDKSTNLLGMGKSKSWSLISNWVDDTHLHNKLAYDLAQEVGIDFSANSKHVDLYINNEYQGLYVLTERNNVEDNHVDITDLEKLTEKANNVTDLSTYKQKGTNSFSKNTYKYYDIPNNPSDITGGYLIEFELSGRYSSEPSGFVTTRGQAVVVKSPEFATKKQVEYIRAFFQEMEDAIYAPNGYNSKGKHYTEYVDEDSLIRMYLLQEFCMNLDASISSFFFYKDSDKVGDGKLHAAPPWDFDNAFGLSGPRDGVNLWDPQEWWANAGRIHEDPSWTPHMLNAVYKHDEFVQKAIRIWHTDFVPAINKMIYPTNNNPTKIVDHIEVYRDLIRDSAVMNNIFWYNSWNTIDARVSSLTGFMRTRATFLCENWITNINKLEVAPISPMLYTGSSITPKVVIKDMGVVLKEDKEYTVSYSNNKSIGTATVKITMKGYYSGSKKINFFIVESSKSSLVTAINAAESKVQKNYTTESWNALQSKLSAARSVITKTNASKNEIDKATSELNQAINALRSSSKLDKTILQGAINSANGKKANDYTKVTWDNMQSKLSGANTIYNSATATQAEIDNVTTALLNSIGSLKLIDNSKKTPTPSSDETPTNTVATPDPSNGNDTDTGEITVPSDGKDSNIDDETTVPSNGKDTNTDETTDISGSGDSDTSGKSPVLKYVLVSILVIVIVGGVTVRVVFFIRKKKFM